MTAIHEWLDAHIVYIAVGCISFEIGRLVEFWNQRSDR